MSWTDDRVELLKKLWGEGKTASEIAKVLGGVTRNAVIGKAHRLKLSGRASPIQQQVKKTTVDAASNSNTAPKRAPRVKSSETSANIPVKRVKLSDLKDRQCRFPLGDPRDKDFAFCGCRAMPGIPYCTEHAQIAYQVATRKKLLSAEEFEKQEAKGRSQNDEETLESLRQAG